MTGYFQREFHYDARGWDADQLSWPVTDRSGSEQGIADVTNLHVRTAPGTYCPHGWVGEALESLGRSTAPASWPLPADCPWPVGRGRRGGDLPVQSLRLSTTAGRHPGGAPSRPAAVVCRWAAWATRRAAGQVAGASPR